MSRSSKTLRWNGSTSLGMSECWSNLAPGEPNSEGESFEEVCLYGRLRAAAEVGRTRDELLPLLLAGRVRVDEAGSMSPALREAGLESAVLDTPR